MHVMFEFDEHVSDRMGREDRPKVRKRGRIPNSQARAEANKTD